MTTLNTIIEEEKKELESFDSFFAGLASWEEKNAVKLYEKYVLSAITTAMQRVAKATREETIRDIYEIATVEVNQSSSQNAPIYVREMQAIKTYARLRDIDLSTLNK